MKKQYLVLLICMLFYNSNSFAQNTVQELGERIFLAFKSNSPEQIMSLRLGADEVGRFWVSKGIDTNTTRFTNYMSKYPDITNKLFQSCKTIEADTVGNLRSWKDTKLDTVKIISNNSNSDMLCQIKMKSNGNKYVILFEAFQLENGTWKLSNSISTPNSNDNRKGLINTMDILLPAYHFLYPNRGER